MQALRKVVQTNQPVAEQSHSLESDYAAQDILMNSDNHSTFEESVSLTPIGVAVVEHEGKYLVGIRNQNSTLAGKAEFPGGKKWKDESFRECAERECLEETGLPVEGRELIFETEWEYEHDAVLLQFWKCSPVDPSAVSSTHREFVWVSREELLSLPFPAANASLMQLLSDEDNQ